MSSKIEDKGVVQGHVQDMSRTFPTKPVAGVKSMMVSEKGMADSDTKKEQSGFNARTQSFLNSFLKHSTKLENEEKA